jgi:O-antigen/teichoic acid export membrane protein
MRNLKISTAIVTIVFAVYFNYILIEAFGLIGMGIGIIAIEIILIAIFLLIKKHIDK